MITGRSSWLPCAKNDSKAALSVAASTPDPMLTRANSDLPGVALGSVPAEQDEDLAEIRRRLGLPVAARVEQLLRARIEYHCRTGLGKITVDHQRLPCISQIQVQARVLEQDLDMAGDLGALRPQPSDSITVLAPLRAQATQPLTHASLHIQPEIIIPAPASPISHA